MSNLFNQPIALIADDGDSYNVYVSEETERSVRITQILRYLDNKNVQPEDIAFRDLSPRTKTDIIHSINRRYPGRMVRT